MARTRIEQLIWSTRCGPVGPHRTGYLCLLLVIIAKVQCESVQAFKDGRVPLVHGEQLIQYFHLQMQSGSWFDRCSKK